ncbi:MAG TPA: methyltransferase domain-containing protein [Dongiaceae bacterium]|nr:methyltransferase domain-containing protein [Dongiaceae bacterium]
MSHDSIYVHGTSGREQERLRMMNEVINPPALRRIDVRPGDRVAEFASGLGQMSRAFARAAGANGLVVGVERSAAQRDAAIAMLAETAAADPGRAPIDLRLGDALAPPFAEGEWGSFDIAHTRFLLEHLPSPCDLVRVMVRAVRPGGRVILQDEDHEILRLWPEIPGFMAVWNAYIESYERAGNDPRVGRKLVALLHEAGARPSRSDWVFFGGCSGEPRFAPLVENLARVLEGAAEATAATGKVSAAQVIDAAAAARVWGRRPGAALWFALAWVEGIRSSETD